MMEFPIILLYKESSLGGPVIYENDGIFHHFPAPPQGSSKGVQKEWKIVHFGQITVTLWAVLL